MTINDKAQMTNVEANSNPRMTKAEPNTFFHRSDFVILSSFDIGLSSFRGKKKGQG